MTVMSFIRGVGLFVTLLFSIVSTITVLAVCLMTVGLVFGAFLGSLVRGFRAIAGI